MLSASGSVSGPETLLRNPGIPASVALSAALMLSAGGAEAAVTISTAATQNMSCAGGVCTPTSADAVLNVTDLETLLAAGNLKVTTTGSGVQAEDIVVEGAFSWSSGGTSSRSTSECPYSSGPNTSGART